MFKLLRHFSLTSAIAIAAITIVLVLGYRQVEERSLRKNAEGRNVAQSLSLANVLLDRYWQHIQNPSAEEPDALRSLEVTRRLEADVQQFIRNLPILKIKIYNQYGLAVFSTDSKEIGLRTDEALLRSIIARARPFSRISKSDPMLPLHEQRTSKVLFETYVPILMENGRVSAVVESYTDISEQVASLDRDMYTMLGFLLSAMLTLYGLLFLLVRRADQILRVQYDELQALRTNLEDKVEARTRALLDLQDVMSQLARSEEFRTGGLEAFAQLLTRSTALTLGVERVCLWRLLPEMKSVKSVAVYHSTTNDFTSGRSVDMPSYESFFGVLLRQEIVVADDVKRHPATQCLVDTYASHRGIGAMLVAPIIHGGKVEGVLALEHVGGAFKWTAEHRLFAIAVANFASLAFERQQRTLVEIELREAYKSVEAANKAKSLFLANMSHEIRTPMNGVFGMTDLLMRTELTDRQRKFVSVISGSAKRLLTIINDILDISRIESGKLELDLHDFSLRSCVEDTVELVMGEAERKGIDLDVYIGLDVPDAAVGDSGRLRQILTNLISNAVKFTNDGGVSVRVTSSAESPQLSRVHVEVSDTGIGISPDLQRILFAPFQQADTSISRRFGGTGLGLSISRHLVEMMGGEIRLESTQGVGTRVAFSVPLPVKQQQAFPVQFSKDLEGLRVLVVDDRETNLEVLASYLRDCGAVAACAMRASSAYDELCKAVKNGSTFDVVLVDMLMPGGNGFEFAHMVRSNPDLASLKMVLVTSLNWRGDAKVARELGFAAFLSKPVRRDDLVNAVRLSLSPLPSTCPIVSAPAPSEINVPIGLRVLVAEDNPVNVEVAREYLEGMGCRVTCAENGIAAVKAFEANSFDIILMDCQMPELDGLGATQQIRSIEIERQARRLPVIAVTANAYAEDRDLCLEAGMDDYMSKPFSEEQLRRMLARWAPQAASATAAPAALNGGSSKSAVVVPEPETPVVGEGAVDSQVLVQMQKTHASLLGRLLDTYLGYSPKAIQQLMAALEAKNHGQLMITAHSLKSSSANLGANKLAGLCRDLEQRLKASEVWADDANVAAVMEIEKAFFEAHAELSAFKAQLPPPPAKVMRA